MSGLLGELKRRNVIRMAGLYLVGAWLIVQVAGTLLPVFEAPPWVMKTLVAFLALGFVPALVFAWVFELTPEGIKRDAEVKPEESIAPQTARRMDRMIFVVMALALAYFVFDKFLLVPRRESARETRVATGPGKQEAADASRPAPEKSSDTVSRAIPTDSSIAVLPFVNMSSDKEQEYFSDGLSEELLNQLAQIPQLRVIARTSSFSFKGKEVDVATIAKALNVANVLEGSVRKSGSNLRITAQLIRTADSSHLWSKTYDREMSDVFKVQDEIAGEVVASLKLTLLPDRKPISAGRTDNIEAYNHFLRGREFAIVATSDSYRRAIAEYQRAIELDPAYTTVYVNLAAAQVMVADLSADPVGQMRAQQAIEKALALSPGDPEALAIRGWMRSLFLWDWEGARTDLEAALSVNANNATTLVRYSWLIAALGRLPEAISAAEKANKLDPLADQAATYLGMFLNAAGRYAQAREVAERRLKASGRDDFANLVFGAALVLDGKAAQALVAMQPGDSERAVDAETSGVRLSITALAEHSLGHESESARALDELKKNHAAGFAFQVAEVHAWRGEKDQAFEWLDRAYSQRDGGMAMIKFDPFLVSLRDDPRYAAMVRKLGLPE
ncbi:MAG TPA: tetratricopeptide repeat protein [Rhodanobacteraceae bacterium]|nr:tetratricopeptide repeat protein [Rhodanobacteraceae bacterium]